MFKFRLVKCGFDSSNFFFFHYCQIITGDPEHIKMILTTQFEDFERGPEVRQLLYPVLGTGVFAAEGQYLTRKL